MRTKEENREYFQRRRYNEKLNKMKERKTECYYCDNPAETLHHKNENHADNNSSNLIPLCRSCHTEALHKSDVLPKDWQKPSRKANKPRFPLKKQMLQPKTMESLLESCNTDKIFNVTIKKPGTNTIWHIHQARKRTLEFLRSLGFTEIVS